MNNFSLVRTARDLLNIHEDIPFRLKGKYSSSSDFELYDFTQTWGNTSGGFEGWGGDAITNQRTYVLIPENCNEDCFVYFDGQFAYSVPYSDTFMRDVLDRKVAGKASYKKYLE